MTGKRTWHRKMRRIGILTFAAIVLFTIACGWAGGAFAGGKQHDPGGCSSCHTGKSTDPASNYSWRGWTYDDKTGIHNFNDPNGPSDEGSPPSTPSSQQNGQGVSCNGCGSGSSGNNGGASNADSHNPGQTGGTGPNGNPLGAGGNSQNGGSVELPINPDANAG